VSLENTELKIGSTSFKGVWIAIVLGIGSTIGGGVWTASSLYSRLEAVEARKIPDIKPLSEQVQLINEQLETQDISKLQGNLAELGTNLVVIKEQQGGLLLIREDVSELKNSIEAMKGTVAESKVITKNLGDVAGKINNLEREVQQLWDGLDYVANPYK